MINDCLEECKKDKLNGALELCWLLTVFSSFFGDALFSEAFPAVGTLSPFRIFLPLTLLLYVIYAFRKKEHIWSDSSTLKRWCYVFIGIMLIYGALSLLRAIDFIWTFRRLFNLCMDMAFFFLMLRLCKEKSLFRATLLVSAAAIVLLCAGGVYEVFNGGIFYPSYNNYHRFEFLGGIYQPALVTYPNTNDYNSAGAFCTSVILFAFIGKKLYRQKAFLTFGIALAVGTFFVMLASGARLVMFSFFLLLAALFVFFFMADKKRIWIPTVVLISALTLQFISQYRYIVPPIQKYLSQMQKYNEEISTSTQFPAASSAAASSAVSSGSTSGAVSSSQASVPSKPNLVIGDKTIPSLEDQFMTKDSNGNDILNSEASAGARTYLLLYTGKCFIRSYGLGVGLGNTEQLALLEKPVPGRGYWSMHCFLARLIADYGIFALIPLAAIAFLLLRQGIRTLRDTLRAHNRHLAGSAVLFLAVILVFLPLSTASSDAQDIIAMWFFLASLIHFADRMRTVALSAVFPEVSSFECAKPEA